MTNPCIFCEIIAGRLPGDIIFQDELITVFRDRFPRAPVHLLIVPNFHIASVNELTGDHQPTISRLLLTARDQAASHGLAENGYRLVINTGRDAGQSVHHLHLHLLGGKSMPLMGG